MMRWHGTTIGSGFQRSACATARVAAGLPISAAMPAYEVTAPYGTAAVARSTARWKSLRARRRSSAHSSRVRSPRRYSRSSRKSASISAPSSCGSTPLTRESREAARSLRPPRYSTSDTPCSDRAMRMWPSGEGKMRYDTRRDLRSASRDSRPSRARAMLRGAAAGARRRRPPRHRSRGSDGTRRGTARTSRCGARPGARRRTRRRPSRRRRGRLRSPDSFEVCPSSWLLRGGRRERLTVETQPDLAQRLEHVGPRALRRAIEALPDGLVVELVDLSHDERLPLLEREPADRARDQPSGLAEPRFVLRPARVGLAALDRSGLERYAPAFLRAKVIAGQVRRDREQPRAHVGLGAERPVRAIGAQERLLGEVLGFGGPRRHAPDVAIDLGVVRADDGLERLSPHHALRHRCGPDVKGPAGLAT